MRWPNAETIGSPAGKPHTALGRTKLHIGDERGAHEVAEIAKVMLTTTAPVVRRHAAWYLAVQAMTAGDPGQAHRWLCALGEAERLSLFPLFPMEAAEILSQSAPDLEQAAAILAPGPRPLALAAVLEDLGCTRLADGDRSGAADAFDRVLRICIDAGAVRDAARARKRLRELGNTHLRHVFDKLDIRSRVDLTRAVEHHS